MVDIDKKRVGNRIAQLRKQKRKSMENFASLLQVSGKSTVNEWEKGRSLPNDSTLERISEVFNVDKNWILFGSIEEYYNDVLVEAVKSNQEFEHAIIEYLELSSDLNEFENGIIFDNNGKPLPIEKYDEAISEVRNSLILDSIEEKMHELTSIFSSNNLVYGDDFAIVEAAINAFKSFSMGAFFSFSGAYHKLKKALNEMPILSMGNFDNPEVIKRLQEEGKSNESILDTIYGAKLNNLAISFSSELTALYSEYESKLRDLKKD